MPKYFLGDFNAGATNTFGGLLEDVCIENDFIISDYALLPEDTFICSNDIDIATRVNDSMRVTCFGDSFSTRVTLRKMVSRLESPFSPNDSTRVTVNDSSL